MGSPSKKSSGSVAEDKANLSKNGLRKGQPSDATRYNKTVAAANLRTIRLVGATFKVAPVNGLRLNHPVWLAPRQSFERAKGLLVSIHEWKVLIDAGNSMAADISTSFLLSYDNLPDEDEEIVIRLVDRIGKFTTYPYFRSHVANMLSMAGVSSPPLELLKAGR